MTPPDSKLSKQKRRHAVPLFGLALVAIIAVGAILYWISGEIVTAPEQEQTESVSPDDIREGDVDVPETLPTLEVEPDESEIEVTQ
jgi:hypothetical protein